MCIKSQKGFTLTEAIIVVGLISLIAALAMSSYSNYVRKSKRSDAIRAVTRAAALQENWFAANNTYIAEPDPFNQSGTVAITSPEGYYTITVGVGGGGTSFTVTANVVAGGPQGEDAATCNGFTLNQIGVRGMTTGTPADCWD